MNRLEFALVATLTFASFPVAAHHGYDDFFDPKERTVAIDGMVENLVYGNPHIVLSIRTADGVLHKVIWQSARWVERRSLATPTTFNVGDRLFVIGAPARDPANSDITRIRELRRPTDGWHWRSTNVFASPSARFVAARTD